MGPIARTYTGYKPCLDPAQHEYDPIDDYLYPLEVINKFGVCEIDGSLK